MSMNRLPEPVPYSGDNSIPRTELVSNDAGLLMQSELSYARSFIHVSDSIRATHEVKLREAEELSEDEIADIERRGVGSRPSADGLTVPENLVYAIWGRRGLVLDLYVPETVSAPCPVLLILHGGGWIQNSHRTYRSFAMKLAKRGYATACVEYRLAGESASSAPRPAASSPASCRLPRTTRATTVRKTMWISRVR